MDRGEFIDELRAKLPPFIKERIKGWRTKYAEKQTAFSDRLAPYNKKRDEIRAAYSAYLNEGLPRDVEKKKKRAIRPFLCEAIPYTIGVLVFCIWILPALGLDMTLVNILVSIGLAVFLLYKPVVKFRNARRYAESQNVVDELAREWCDKNGMGELESRIEAIKDEWNTFSKSLQRCVRSAELALSGSDENMLEYYNTDKQAKNWYLENIYDGEW
jgi:hypothetical protein